MTKRFNILLYYHYTKIEDPEVFRTQHHLFCLELNLLGRIIIATEGINGTISGLKESCQQYMAILKNDTRFQGIDFKVEEYDTHAFQKLNVRVKPEIVNSGLYNLKPSEKTGIHLSPSEFKKLKDKKDVVVVDMRSGYEYQVGKFKNAITLEIDNFREMPEKVKALEKFRDKKIITYCTGGIKCEKASAYLLEQGFKDVYQLEGGIIKYAIEEGGEDFEGKCYVFDNRITVDVNKINPVVISRCHICSKPSDRMVNCANPECNNHVPICEECGWTMEGACSDECKEHPKKRPYNGTGYYPKELNGYDPFLNAVRK